MTLVGELVLARNQILQFSFSQTDPTFLDTVQRLNQLTTELQAGVMKTRMQPNGNVWGKLPRLVRDLASQLGKEIQLKLEGGDVELDKTILEGLSDPLTHMVRNSGDHGIEAPAARLASGKPTLGTVMLRARHQAGQVVIEISDDGKGLSGDKIAASAVAKGMLTAEQALTRDTISVGVDAIVFWQVTDARAACAPSWTRNS